MCSAPKLFVASYTQQPRSCSGLGSKAVATMYSISASNVVMAGTLVLHHLRAPPDTEPKCG